MSEPRRRTSRTPKTRREWKPKFLEAFRETGLVTKACEIAKVGRTTVYEARTLDEKFALAWAQIEDETTETMEREAFRRAVEGTEKPLVSAGKHVTNVREYSDTLLIFMLKARRPERYRDNVKVEHTGTVKAKVELPDEPAWHAQVAQVLLETGAFTANGDTNGDGTANGNGSDPH